MNEYLFISHIFVVLIFTLISLRLGKYALFALICSQAIFANLFVLKQITCFSLSITCCDVFVISGTLGLNLMQEYYGAKIAKKAAVASFLLMIFFAAISKIHLLYIPNSFDTTHDSYYTILSQTPRILAASLFSFFVVQQIDIRLFGWIKKRFANLNLSTRNTLSLITTQAIDTILFSFLGLYGLVENIYHIILVSFVVKVAVIFMSYPVTAISKKLLYKQVEQTT